MISVSQVEFAESVHISEVHIYKTLNAGAVTRVAATNTSGQWVTLWEAEDGPSVITSSRIFQPQLTVSAAAQVIDRICFSNCLFYII